MTRIMADMLYLPDGRKKIYSYIPAIIKPIVEKDVHKVKRYYFPRKVKVNKDLFRFA